jgi:hypothetical protein
MSSGTISTTGYKIVTSGYSGTATGSTIPGTGESNINLTFSNPKDIIINSTMLVPRTAGLDGPPVTGTGTIRNADARIELKDRTTGQFRPLYIDDGDMFIQLQNGTTPEFIRTDNLATEINNLDNMVIFNNVYIQADQANTGYINFLQMPNPTEPDLIPAPNVGFRVSNGVIQFKNSTAQWRNIASSVETFIKEQHLFTSSGNVALPFECVGVRIRASGGGGQGGYAFPGVYSQGGGGGSGGYAERFIRVENLQGVAPEITFTMDSQAVDGRGGDVSVYYRRSNIETTYIVVQATGGYPGSNADPSGYSIGGNGGYGGLTLLPWETGVLVTSMGMVFQGNDGFPGFRSETQNLRYYSGGRGGDSALGSGGRGLIPNDPALDQTTGRLGGGGGGGLFVPGAVFGPSDPDVSEDPQTASTGAVVIEFYLNEDLAAESNGGGGGGVTRFTQLQDTLVDESNLATKPYLKYQNTGLGYFIENVPLRIVDDSVPQLGGDLACATSNIGFTDGFGITSNAPGSNLIVAFSNPAALGDNHLVITKTLVSGDVRPTITVAGLDANISTVLRTKGSGNLHIDLDDGVSATAGSLLLDVSSLAFNTGSLVSSITEYADAGLSTNPVSPEPIQAENGVLLFNISANNIMYYAKLDAGISGQNLNIIFEASGSNSSVNLSFYNNTWSPSTANVGVGTGLATNLIFNTPGQAASLVYLDIYPVGDPNERRNRWQATTTGCFTLP